MGQEVKNPLRAQSKYGLMGSSAKTGKFCFRGSPEHFLDKNAIWDRTPPTYTSIALYICGGGFKVPNLQTEFNYLDLFKSYGIFSDFVVPMVPTLSLLSPRRVYHPHVVPVSSPSSPQHPHSPQKVPMWSPWLWSPWSPLLSPWSPPHVVPMVPTSSLSSPHRPRVIPIIPTSYPWPPEGPHVVPMAVVSSVVSRSPPHVVPVVPVVPTSFPSSPCHPCVIPVVPTSSP